MGQQGIRWQSYCLRSGSGLPTNAWVIMIDELPGRAVELLPEAEEVLVAVLHGLALRGALGAEVIPQLQTLNLGYFGALQGRNCSHLVVPVLVPDSKLCNAREAPI